jgi:hypothetical protein
MAPVDPTLIRLDDKLAGLQRMAARQHKLRNTLIIEFTTRYSFTIVLRVALPSGGTAFAWLVVSVVVASPVARWDTILWLRAIH